VVENGFGREALIFRVGKIEWVSDTELTVGGGYEEANLSSSGNKYTVKKQDGKWTTGQGSLRPTAKGRIANVHA
jgi:hypothetical protein